MERGRRRVGKTRIGRRRERWGKRKRTGKKMRKSERIEGILRLVHSLTHYSYLFEPMLNVLDGDDDDEMTKILELYHDRCCHHRHVKDGCTVNYMTRCMDSIHGCA